MLDAIRVRITVLGYFFRNIRKWPRWLRGRATRVEVRSWNQFAHRLEKKYGYSVSHVMFQGY